MASEIFRSTWRDMNPSLSLTRVASSQLLRAAEVAGARICEAVPARRRRPSREERASASNGRGRRAPEGRDGLAKVRVSRTAARAGRAPAAVHGLRRRRRATVRQNGCPRGRGRQGTVRSRIRSGPGSTRPRRRASSARRRLGRTRIRPKPARSAALARLRARATGDRRTVSGRRAGGPASARRSTRARAPSVTALARARPAAKAERARRRAGSIPARAAISLGAQAPPPRASGRAALRRRNLREELRGDAGEPVGMVGAFARAIRETPGDRPGPPRRSVNSRSVAVQARSRPACPSIEARFVRSPPAHVRKTSARAPPHSRKTSAVSSTGHSRCRRVERRPPTRPAPAGSQSARRRKARASRGPRGSLRRRRRGPRASSSRPCRRRPRRALAAASPSGRTRTSPIAPPRDELATRREDRRVPPVVDRREDHGLARPARPARGGSSSGGRTSGFSQRTCTPGSERPATSSACMAGGAQMSTKSSSSRASSSSAEACQRESGARARSLRRPVSGRIRCGDDRDVLARRATPGRCPLQRHVARLR